MINHFESGLFSLSNETISYLLRVNSEGHVEHVHFGGVVHHPERAPSQHKRVIRSLSPEYENIPQYSLADLPQEYPSCGRGDYRQPALQLVDANGHQVGDLKYQSHQILSEKPRLHGLPSARSGDCQTLILTLVDEHSQIEVDCYYTIYAEHSVITRSCKISNRSNKSVTLQQVYSTCLDLPQDDYELLHFTGTWAREFATQRHPLNQGRFIIESARGNSSAQHQPFMALVSPDTNEDHGRVFASSLLYSGNFAASVEKTEFNDVRFLMGINPHGFHWHLKPQDSFTTPEVVHVYSDHGLTGMSHTFHDFIEAKISPPQFVGKKRPSYLNTWEAAYFDLSEERVYELAQLTQSLGLEMLVVDDGWFAGRTDDRRSLGDWTPDKERFPSGIPSLAKKVKSLDLKFGIWVEPEMINEDSQLYREHPDWILHIPGRTSSTGRNQLTLDFSRIEVVDHIYQQLDELFACGLIDYVKWDMNRTMTEVGSAAWPAEQQAEVPHRYILGLYSLLDRLTQKYPNILFENCASGGNRHDLGMLFYMSQSWASDMSEPIGRLQIQQGVSHIYPLSTYSSYLCPTPGHQNGREVSLATRFNVAYFCGSRGLSLSEKDIAKHRFELKEYIEQFKQSSDDAVNGRFYRLFHTDNDTSWQLSSADKERHAVGYFSKLTIPNTPFRRAYLKGLDPQGLYQRSDTQQVYSGSALMEIGLDLPYVSPTQDSEASPARLEASQRAQILDGGDFVSALIHLIKVTDT